MNSLDRGKDGRAGMSAGWEVKTLGELVDVLDHKRKPITKRDREAGSYPYYGATGILDYVNGFLFDEALVLVGEDGAKWASGDNTAFSVQGKIWVNNHAHVLRPNRRIVIDQWLIYHLNNTDLSEFVSGLTVPKLNQGSLKEIPVPLPPLAEQQRIVAILDEAFEGIATARKHAEQNLQNAKALFESHLEAVFSQKGEGWVEKKLGDVYDVWSSKRIMETDWTESGVPFYGGRELVQLAKYGTTVSNAFISEEKYQDYASKFDMPQKDDVLITARGTIGVGYVVNHGDKFYYKDGNIISMRAKVASNPYFLLYQFRSAMLQIQFDNLNGTTVRHLSIEKAKELVLNLPDKSIQDFTMNYILNIENETNRLCDIYTQKIAALDALKKSLLHQAFSGEL